MSWNKNCNKNHDLYASVHKDKKNKNLKSATIEKVNPFS